MGEGMTIWCRFYPTLQPTPYLLAGLNEGFNFLEAPLKIP